MRILLHRLEGLGELVGAACAVLALNALQEVDDIFHLSAFHQSGHAPRMTGSSVECSDFIFFRNSEMVARRSFGQAYAWFHCSTSLQAVVDGGELSVRYPLN